MTTTAPEQLTPPAADAALPGPGVYPGMSPARYHALPKQYASNSRLSMIARSPAHLKAYLDGGTEKTSAALRVGSPIHCAILEPDAFPSRYTQRPEGMDLRRTADKAHYAELQLKYGPDNILTAAEYRMCLAVRDAVYAKPLAKALLVGEHRELTIISELDGLLVKSRLDHYNADLATIVDIKSTTDARRDAFERSIFTYGYHRQGALYKGGAEAHKLPVRHFVNIAVEKEPPHAAALFRMTEAAIDAGAQQLVPLMATYRQCLATDQWPAYPDEIQDVALPPWAWAQIDAETGGGA